MKLLIGVLFVTFIVNSMALPAYRRMAYYQQPLVYYPAQAPSQRMMVLQQYVQQPRTQSRSAAYAAGDSVAAGSYLKEDCIPSEGAVSGEQHNYEAAKRTDLTPQPLEPYPPQDDRTSAEFEGTFADSPASQQPVIENPSQPEIHETPLNVAPLNSETPDAPAEDNQILDDIFTPSAEAPLSTEALPNNNGAKTPREYHFDTPSELPLPEDAEPQLPSFPEYPQSSIASETPEATYGADIPAHQAHETPAAQEIPVTPIAPARNLPAAAARPTPVAAHPPSRYLPPRKKIVVKLDEENFTSPDDVDIDADNYRPSRIPIRRPPNKGSSSNAPAIKANGQAHPATYFPVSFGGTTGGAIAIANSFSTGEGGSATSHAIAYGSPDAVRIKNRPIRRY